MRHPRKVLITGATGCIGSWLLKELAGRDLGLRCLVRRLDSPLRNPEGKAEVVQGDLLEPASLRGAFEGVDTAYFLVHSMGAIGEFQDKERLSAVNFARQAKADGVGRIIYLGGLVHGRARSSHLQSRREVGEILRQSGVPTIEFRASIVIGPGSLSFEMIRLLVERLPIVPTPGLIEGRAQPIALEDVVRYLAAAVDLPLEGSRVFEIGGADSLSYADIMREYARQRGLRRGLVCLPFLTPALLTAGLRLVTPIPPSIGRRLIESLGHETTVHDGAALEAFPIRPMGLAQAVGRALAIEDREFALTSWLERYSREMLISDWETSRAGSRWIDSGSLWIPDSLWGFKPPPAAGLAAIAARRILGSFRPSVDLLLGNGQKEHELGAAADRPGGASWRVESIARGKLLRLFTERPSLGRIWLQIELSRERDGLRLRQTSTVDPVGLEGLALWGLLSPLRRRVLSSLLREIAAHARAVLPGR